MDTRVKTNLEVLSSWRVQSHIAVRKANVFGLTVVENIGMEHCVDLAKLDTKKTSSLMSALK